MFRMNHIGLVWPKEQELQEPIHAPAALTMVDESGITPEPERMGEKVPTYVTLLKLKNSSIDQSLVSSF